MRQYLNHLRVPTISSAQRKGGARPAAALLILGAWRLGGAAGPARARGRGAGLYAARGAGGACRRGAVAVVGYRSWLTRERGGNRIEGHGWAARVFPP
eukprot:COSAG01_NODE_6078_length_3864_cov_12.433510_3_plen_98_part_00